MSLRLFLNKTKKKLTITTTTTITGAFGIDVDQIIERITTITFDANRKQHAIGCGRVEFDSDARVVVVR